jgi:hypothetical protein
MKLAIALLLASFVALVVALVIIYRPAPAQNRAISIEEAMASSPTPLAQPTTSASQKPAPAPNPGPASANPAEPSSPGQPAPDAGAMLKDEHSIESATQFDRALLFLAPAAPAPMIEQPVATAAATAVIPDSAAPITVPEEARTWRGAVLVPKSMLLATAHTTLVRIPRIEAHPLEDGNVRIWARIQNPAENTIKVGTACTFRYSGQLAGVSRGFLEVEIPPGGYYDADFLSPHSGVETYTILVRSLE